MMRAMVLCLCLCLLGTAVLAQPAQDQAAANALAQAMDGASHNEGFRLRAQITPEGGDESWRVVIAGEKDALRLRLLLRVQAPEPLRGQALVLHAQPDLPVQALRFGVSDGPARVVDATEPFLGTGIVPWDFTGAWWRWPRQTWLREEACLSQRCQVLESSGRLQGRVARVRSWYAPQLQLTLRLEFLSADGKRLRELRVDRFVQRPDGSGAARTLTLTDAGGVVRRLDIYNGEEGVALGPDTFRTPQ